VHFLHNKFCISAAIRTVLVGSYRDTCQKQPPEETMETVHLSAQQIDELSQVACAAIDTIDEQFGTGFPSYEQPGKTPLSSHNGHHGRAVKRDAGLAAEASDLSTSEVALAETAGAAHDVVQLLGRGIDEAESAAWLAERLRRLKDMPEPVAAVGSLAIIGTQPIFKDGLVVGQKASFMDYPSKRGELVIKSVACGDFGELYTPFGPFVAHELYREIHRNKPFSMENLLEFQRNQVRLLNTFQYPLAVAEKVLATHRTEVTAYVGKVLLQMERGEMHSLRQLRAQDLDFLRRHETSRIPQAA
jgi:hypothetical protein